MKNNYIWQNISLLIIHFLLASCLSVGGDSFRPTFAASSATPETKSMTTEKAPSVTYTPKAILRKSGISGWVTYSSIVHRDPQVTQIFVKNLDTSEMKQLTYSGNNSSPRWSPDGSQILFLSWSKENSYDIYLMEKDGKHQKSLVSGPDSEKMVDWSPDGNKIVFVSDKDGKFEIYTLDLLTMVISKITSSSDFAIAPSWSSNGKYIAFASSEGGAGRSQIFVMNANGTNIKQVTSYNIDNFDGAPVWCPDDSCIVFTRFVNGVPKLMVLDFTNQKVTPLFHDTFDAKLQETRPDCSPLMGYITFSVGGDFYAMDLSNREIYPLDVQALELSLYP